MAADLSGGGGLNQEPATWLAIFTAVGGAGMLGKFWDHLFHGRAETEKTRAETAKAFQDVLDAKIQRLIEGYENRISELTAEVHNLRAEVIALRKALDTRGGAAGFGV